MDPITLLAAATTAYNAIKKGFEIGRDIESMYSDIGRWMGAMSEISKIEEQIKNPPLFKQLFFSKSIEQEAIDIFAAKKKAKEMEDELRIYIQFQYGVNAWNELLAIQARIRKERKEALDAQKNLRNSVLENVTIFLLMVFCLGILSAISWFVYAHMAM
jgi:hypothetical protein